MQVTDRKLIHQVQKDTHSLTCQKRAS